MYSIQDGLIKTKVTVVKLVIMCNSEDRAKLEMSKYCRNAFLALAQEAHFFMVIGKIRSAMGPPPPKLDLRGSGTI